MQCSSNYLANRTTMHIGWPSFLSIMVKGKALVVEAHQV